jgi:hypothetical protein
MNQQPISFPQWKLALASAPLSPAVKAADTREILGFLKHCKAGRIAATVEAAKGFLNRRGARNPTPAPLDLRPSA